MSIFTTLFKDGFGAAVKLIPSYYLIGAGVLVLGGLFVWGKIWFHNKVEAEAQKEINAYIAIQKKDAAELQEVSTGVNTKIQLQYVDKVKVITKTVHSNGPVIIKYVPDTKTVLSNGWIAAYNAIVQGINIDSKIVADNTPSGVTAVAALSTDNTNYGICLQYKAVAQGWQEWYTQQQTAISSANKKDK